MLLKTGLSATELYKVHVCCLMLSSGTKAISCTEAVVGLRETTFLSLVIKHFKKQKFETGVWF